MERLCLPGKSFPVPPVYPRNLIGREKEREREQFDFPPESSPVHNICRGNRDRRETGDESLGKTVECVRIFATRVLRSD